jgi:hypothetical protein
MKNRNEDNTEFTTEQVFIKVFYKKVEIKCVHSTHYKYSNN